jgi:putative sterol carrier protein
MVREADLRRSTVDRRTTSPDCVISTSAADFIEIAEGNRNLITAFLQGRIGISGDLALAIAFRRLLPVTS